MPLGQFQNQTDSKCTLPLLDQSLFSEIGGYQQGRYCGLGSFKDGTTCCFPCPIQDWLYPPEWKSQLRVPNYLAILSVVLCCFLLLSFAVLPPEQTHRHYLSVGLLFPVLFISLSFAIPVTTNPDLCHDQITPNDIHSSLSCAWTGSLVALGGLGCVIWVFLRSLWLHIRIFWDKDPGHRFKWGSIVFGTVMPFIFLAVILVVTGFSYRMGQTCLPNHEHAIVTFWIWLVIFAILAFLLQFITTVYCFWVYMRTIWREHRSSSANSSQQRRAKQKLETWSHVRRLFLLQWRNILVSIFVIIGSLSFFIVFWTQDGKLGKVFNDPENIKPVKTWIICQTLSKGDKEECRKYVDNFTVNQTAVLTSLILASLVGIEIFVLLFRKPMLTAWLALFRRTIAFFHHQARPSTPQLTSLDNAEQYLPFSPTNGHRFFSALAPTTANTNGAITEMGALGRHSTDDRTMSHTELLSPEAPQGWNSLDQESGTGSESSKSRALMPTPITKSNLPTTTITQPTPTVRRLSQVQPAHSPFTSIPRSYIPMREAPAPPNRPSSVSSGSINIKYEPSFHNSSVKSRTSTTSTAIDGEAGTKHSSHGVQRSGTMGSVRGRISAPITDSFVHTNGAFLERVESRASLRSGGPLGLNPVDEGGKHGD
ncbi:hypothetical protein CC80DRAFT_514137 [Byssothecium circinans]|uniref:G-protein coupled receptors family 2 profile 2 domain-containing protein n=1 Tax=Byssothecium circinans TaxID=147558 RepID=A0A6A5U4Q0_9PLEO|nr:hypothetical protein CC80DRAFT_514137 [Byssothecium circinans]